MIEQQPSKVLYTVEGVDKLAPPPPSPPGWGRGGLNNPQHILTAATIFSLG
jgi:hypothetical protein